MDEASFETSARARIDFEPEWVFEAEEGARDCEEWEVDWEDEEERKAGGGRRGGGGRGGRGGEDI